MGNLLEEFQKEGLLPERMVSNPTAGGQQEELPKINPNAPQTPAVKDVVGTAGDQNKAQDPTKPANELAKEDKMIKSAAASINAAECAMESVCEHANRQQEAMSGGCGYAYDEDKKKKLNEIYETAKQLNQSISALMNQAPMTSTPTPNQAPQQQQQPAPAQPHTLSPVQNQGQPQTMGVQSIAPKRRLESR